MAKNLIALFLVILLVLVAMIGYHYKSIVEIIEIPIKIQHFEDKTNQLDINQIRNQNGFTYIKNKEFNFGNSQSVHWFRFQIEANENTQNISFEVNNISLNKLLFYEISHNGINKIINTGDRYRFTTRPIPTKSFVFPISQDKLQKKEYFLMVDHLNEYFTTTMSFWKNNDFENTAQRNYFLWGIFFGIAVLVIFINIFFWTSTNDRIYFWFGLYILSTASRQLIDTGLAFQYIWPNNPKLNEIEPLILNNWLYWAILISFQKHFLKQKQINKKLFEVGQTIISVLVLACILVIASKILFKFSQNIYTQKTIYFCHTLITFSMLLYFIKIIATYFKTSDQIIKIYIFGFSLQILVQFFVFIQGIFNNETLSTYLMNNQVVLLFVFLIDMIVFSYLLAYRYRYSTLVNDQLILSITENEQNFNKKMIKILDNERNQISKNLNKNIGKKLKNAIELLEKIPISKLNSDAQLLINNVQNTFAKLADNNLPIDLLQHGLERSLQLKIDSINVSQEIKFNLEIKGKTNPLNETVEIQLYRICNELINNILKHSKAQNATISIENNPTNIFLQIIDNGVGFENREISDGIGLKNMYARGAQLNAEINIETGKTGTKISLKIPK